VMTKTRMSPGFAAFGNDLLKDRRAARDNIFQLRIGRNTVTRSQLSGSVAVECRRVQY
jgi:hypothetical protein